MTTGSLTAAQLDALKRLDEWERKGNYTAPKPAITNATRKVLIEGGYVMPIEMAFWQYLGLTMKGWQAIEKAGGERRVL